MREVLVQFKDNTKTKITVAKEQIRIKIQSTLSKDEADSQLAFLLKCADYFNTKEFEVTGRFRLTENYSLKIMHGQHLKLGYATNSIQKKEILGEFE